MIFPINSIERPAVFQSGFWRSLMSVAANSSDLTTASDDHHGDHGHGDHEPFLAHHFGSHRQQFDAAKFGMWLFLVTEILFFSGLFCAYAVYRSAHPEAFANADQYLDVTLGALNTAVLIFSSMTMAWAVRASQLGQTKLLCQLLTITIACASIFLGVKAVEYSHKWDLGILWASAFNPVQSSAHSHALLVLSTPAAILSIIFAVLFGMAKTNDDQVSASFWCSLLISAVAFFGGVGMGIAAPAAVEAITGHGAHEAVAATDTAVAASVTEAEGINPTYTGVFFSIYYVMTGLHAIHILGGMGALSWLLWRSLNQHFGPKYFGPVDFVGLYWHLVDLIWIYLFPLLYLIG